MSSLSQRITEAMHDAGMTAAELARACKISEPSVSNWVNGRTKTLKSSTALKAAAVLGVDVAWLAEGKGSKRPTTDPTREPVSECATGAEPAAYNVSTCQLMIDAARTVRQQLALLPHAERMVTSELLTAYITTPDEDAANALEGVLAQVVFRSNQHEMMMRIRGLAEKKGASSGQMTMHRAGKLR